MPVSPTITPGGWGNTLLYPGSGINLKTTPCAVAPGGGGGGGLPYMGYIGMCRCEGYGFQAVYSRIGNINQSV